MKFAGDPEIFLGPWIDEGLTKITGVLIETKGPIVLTSMEEIQDIISGLLAWAKKAWGQDDVHDIDKTS